MGCKCGNPTKDNPLEELFTEKERERNQNSNNIDETNNNTFKNTPKEIKEIPTNDKFIKGGIKNIESYPQTEIPPPYELLNNGYSKNQISNNNDKNNNNNNDNNNNNNDNNNNDNNINDNDNDNNNDNNNINDNDNNINDNKIIENKNEKFHINSLSENLTDLLPKDAFSKYIFEQINLIRTNPKSFIPIIEKAKKNVTKDIHNRILYKTKVKVALSKGIPSFEETISYLNQIQPMNKLIFNPIICIPLPKNEEEINDKTYLKIKARELVQKKMKIKTYWRDIIKEPETSFILMIVDDSEKKSGLKRKDILNPHFKYIGINSIAINKSFVCYLTFSD